MTLKMKLPDAILYTLSSYGSGMTTDQIAYVINEQRLHVRLDGNPVSGRQVYAVICQYPGIFVKEGGIIHLIM